MWTYPNLKQLAFDLDMRGVTFDQCQTGLRWQKTTFLLATPSLKLRLQDQFGDLVCDHRANEHLSLVGPIRNDARFPSEESAEYTADTGMCGRLVAAIDSCIVNDAVPTAAAVNSADPLDDWNAFYAAHDADTPVASLYYVAETDSEKHQFNDTAALGKPVLQRDTLGAVLASTDPRE